MGELWKPWQTAAFYNNTVSLNESSEVIKIGAINIIMLNT